MHKQSRPFIATHFRSQVWERSTLEFCHPGRQRYFTITSRRQQKRAALDQRTTRSVIGALRRIGALALRVAVCL